MLTRDFRLLEERTRYPLKPLFSHFFLPAPFAIARLDIRLRRAALYPAELWVREGGFITGLRRRFNRLARLIPVWGVIGDPISADHVGMSAQTSARPIPPGSAWAPARTGSSRATKAPVMRARTP